MTDNPVRDMVRAAAEGWPVALARLANAVPGVRWTRDYCAAGCGRPVDGSHALAFDTIGRWEVRAWLCATGGECERGFLADPRDANGVRYSEIRPKLAQAVAEIGDRTPGGGDGSVAVSLGR